jgi:hypothetical protein
MSRNPYFNAVAVIVFILGLMALGFMWSLAQSQEYDGDLMQALARAK